MVHDEDNDDGLGGRFKDRQAVTAANRWAEPLSRLDDLQLAAIALPDWIEDEVRLARKLVAEENWLARERSFGRLDRLVRELEEDEIARIDAFLKDPGEVHRAREELFDGWRRRLLAEGEPAVRAFAEACPGADLQRLRNVVRGLRKGEGGDRARRILDELLAELP